MPCASAISRRGMKAIFVVCYGSLASGGGRLLRRLGRGVERRVQRRGNIDSGSVFHGFRTAEEAGACWREAVGDYPWPVGEPRLEGGLLRRQ